MAIHSLRGILCNWCHIFYHWTSSWGGSNTYGRKKHGPLESEPLYPKVPAPAMMPPHLSASCH